MVNRQMAPFFSLTFIRWYILRLLFENFKFKPLFTLCSGLTIKHVW